MSPCFAYLSGFGAGGWNSRLSIIFIWESIIAKVKSIIALSRVHKGDNRIGSQEIGIESMHRIIVPPLPRAVMTWRYKAEGARAPTVILIVLQCSRNMWQCLTSDTDENQICRTEIFQFRIHTNVCDVWQLLYIFGEHWCWRLTCWLFIKCGRPILWPSRLDNRY